MKDVKHLITLFCCAILVAGCLGPKSLEDLGKEYAKIQSYEVKIQAKNAPVVTQIVKMKEGKMLKLKMTTNMGWNIMDLENKVTYAKMPGNSCMKMPYDPAKQPMGPSFSPTDFASDGKGKNKGKVVGTEKLGEVECIVVEFEDEGKKGKCWIGNDGLVRKVESAENNVTFDYAKINAVPDKDFEVPEGVKVRDMTNLMKGLKNLGNMMGR